MRNKVSTTELVSALRLAVETLNDIPRTQLRSGHVSTKIFGACGGTIRTQFADTYQVAAHLGSILRDVEQNGIFKV